MCPNVTAKAQTEEALAGLGATPRWQQNGRLLPSISWDEANDDQYMNSPTCQKRMDEYCTTSEACTAALRAKGCNTTMLVARLNLLGAHQWRCYSPSALDANLSKYVPNTKGSQCFCTREEQLSSLCSGPRPPPPPSPPRSGGGLSRVPVFTFGEEKYAVFREPAIILLPETGHLLAFIEGGQNHVNADESYPNSNSDVVSKTSTDGGATCEPALPAQPAMHVTRVLLCLSTMTAACFLAGGKLSLVLKNSSQPGAVWDTVNKQVVLNLNGAPHCLGDALTRGCGFNLQMISKDGGVSWGQPVTLDGFLGKQGHAAAGHAGLELTQGEHKGRLLFIGHRGAYVEDTVWYTDDGGATYKTAAHTLPQMDEAQLVENKGGTVIANMRWRGSPTKGRGVATSTDSGATFSAISYDSQLKTTVCQASIWRSQQNGDIYYAAPSSELDHSAGRTHGTIRRSKTGLPGSWQRNLTDVTLPCEHAPCTSTSTVYGYGCLTDVPAKGKGGLLWESVRGTVFSTFELEF